MISLLQPREKRFFRMGAVKGNDPLEGRGDEDFVAGLVNDAVVLQFKRRICSMGGASRDQSAEKNSKKKTADGFSGSLQPLPPVGNHTFVFFRLETQEFAPPDGALLFFTCKNLHPGVMTEHGLRWRAIGGCNKRVHEQSGLNLKTSLPLRLRHKGEKTSIPTALCKFFLAGKGCLAGPGKRFETDPGFDIKNPLEVFPV